DGPHRRRARAHAGWQPDDGADPEGQEEDEADRAERADAAVAHDREPMLGVAPAETVETVGEAVEVQAAGHELPGRHREEPGQERRKEHAGGLLDDYQEHPDTETDYRKPRR